MALLSEQEFVRRAAELEWIICDVDGVLTDGGLYFDGHGAVLQRFDVRDGLAFALARSAGLKVGLLSGRSSPALKRRAAELRLDALMAGVDDKRAALDQFLERHGTVTRRIAFIGDDLPDLVVLGRCGLSFAPADAAPEVRTVVHRVLEARGGRGAVREMVEILLRASGAWEEVFSSYTFDG
ncbi:MAG: phenylphosphate carboxylase subunit delta [Thermoanaerobaculia bacterium]